MWLTCIALTFGVGYNTSCILKYRFCNWISWVLQLEFITFGSEFVIFAHKFLNQDVAAALFTCWNTAVFAMTSSTTFTKNVTIMKNWLENRFANRLEGTLPENVLLAIHLISRQGTGYFKCSLCYLLCSNLLTALTDIFTSATGTHTGKLLSCIV